MAKSKFGPSQRERIQAIVAEHKFDAPAEDTKTADLFADLAPASAEN